MSDDPATAATMASVTRLTASDPEPPVGTRVRDDLGRPWIRIPTGYGDTYWVRTDVDHDDPEPWIKVAGNYGPVEVLS